MKVYFLERCSGGSKSADFWNTVKPFFSKKCKTGEQKIVICENNKIISDPVDVSNRFNNFFATVAEKIGEDVVYNSSTHPSIAAIQENRESEHNFEFQKVTKCKIEKIMNKINI